MALDACCTTRHWLSYVASAWLAYWFLLPQTSPYPTLLVWLWTLKGLKLPRNGSTATHSSQHIECFVTFFVLLLCCCFCFMAPHLGAAFLIVEWKLGCFSSMPALRISPLSWKATGLFHHRCSAVLNGAMSLILLVACSIFSSLVLSFVCVAAHHLFLESTCNARCFCNHMNKWDTATGFMCVKHIVLRLYYFTDLPKKKEKKKDKEGCVCVGGWLHCVGASVWHSVRVWPQWRSPMGGSHRSSGSHGGGWGMRLRKKKSFPQEFSCESKSSWIHLSALPDLPSIYTI